MAMTTKQAAEKWGISDRRVRTLCVNGQIDGAWREGMMTSAAVLKAGLAII